MREAAGVMAPAVRGEPTSSTRTCLVCAAPVDGAPEVVRCAGCGAAFRKTADGLFQGTEAISGVSYPAEGAELTLKIEDASFWFQHRNQVLSTMLDRFSPGGPLWDVGGGNGFQALHFQKQGRAVVMVEPGAAGCHNAKKRGVEQVVLGTLESLKLPGGAVAACSAFDVIEHLERPQELLGECRRVLRPGGRLFVTVPAYGFLWSDEDVFACHHRRYTRRSLRAELETAGFKLELLSYYFQFLLLPVFLLRTLPFRLLFWKRAKAQTMDQGEHVPGATSRRIIDGFLGRELAALRKGRTLSFGSSLVAVATRP